LIDAQRLIREPGGFSPNYKILNLSLRRSEENLIGRDKATFLHFVSKMLKWDPEENATAQELLTDPWLNGELEDAIRLSKFWRKGCGSSFDVTAALENKESNEQPPLPPPSFPPKKKRLCIASTVAIYTFNGNEIEF
jgi:hypothetical protein